MLSHFCQSTFWALGWLPVFLVLYPQAASSEVVGSSAVSLQALSKRRASERVDPIFSKTAFPNPAIREDFINHSLRNGEMLPRGISDTNLSAEKWLQQETGNEFYEPGKIQGFDFVDPMGSDEKPILPKDGLVSASPRIYEFVLAQSHESTPQSSADLMSDPADNIVSPPAAIAQVPPQLGDPELGIIQLRDPLLDPELGIIRLRDPRLDPELGILQLRPLPPAVPDPPDPASPPEPQEPPRRPFVFLSTYVSASNSDNVFLRSEPRRVGDTFIRPGVSLIAFPSIGPRTFLLASLEANFLRYQDFTDFSYNELRFRAGIRHSFTDRVYGQLTWSTQNLFREGFSDRFFRNDSIELFIGRRDSLLPGLTLDSYYQGQLFFTDPNEFSSVSQALGASLSYRFNPQWDARVGYQLTISDFTTVSRHETSQRITAQLRYSLSPSVRMSLFGGVSYGQSSERGVSFDNTFFGISLDATVNLF